MLKRMALIIIVNVRFLTFVFASENNCYLKISGVLDDHYKSNSDYQFSIFINDSEIFYSQRAPFLHGRPYGQIFNNWKTLKILVPKNLIKGDEIKVKFKHTGSSSTDWIGLDYLELEWDGIRIRKELNEYKAYGINDKAIGILYGGETQTREIDIGDEMISINISGVLDDHYNSDSKYLLSVSVDGRLIYDTTKTPFEHGTPRGQTFDNWQILKLPFPKRFFYDYKLVIEFCHKGSAQRDWIGIDYIELEYNDIMIRKELNEYKNYGVRDSAAGILYGNESQIWEIKLQ